MEECQRGKEDDPTQGGTGKYISFPAIVCSALRGSVCCLFAGGGGGTGISALACFVIVLVYHIS